MLKLSHRFFYQWFTAPTFRIVLYSDNLFSWSMIIISEKRHEVNILKLFPLISLKDVIFLNLKIHCDNIWEKNSPRFFIKIFIFSTKVSPQYNSKWVQQLQVQHIPYTGFKIIAYKSFIVTRQTLGNLLLYIKYPQVVQLKRLGTHITKTP